MSCTGNLNNNRAPDSDACFKFKVYYNLFVKYLLTVWSLGHISEHAAALITSPHCLGTYGGTSSLIFCKRDNKTGEEWQPAKFNTNSDTSAISNMAAENNVPRAIFCLFFILSSYISATYLHKSFLFRNKTYFQCHLRPFVLFSSVEVKFKSAHYFFRVLHWWCGFPQIEDGASCFKGFQRVWIPTANRSLELTWKDKHLFIIIIIHGNGS